MGLQWVSGAYQAELSGYPDEGAHYVTGAMVREYVWNGWRSSAPIPFAEQYYLHYPKVAMGHWPPVYYVVQAIWASVFPSSIESIIALQAFLLATAATALFAALARLGSTGAGAVASLIFLILPATQELGSQVMAEPLLAVLTFFSAWAIGAYFETSSKRALVAFAIVVELAILTKGSGLALLGIPFLMIAWTRRWSILARPSFWIAHAAVLAVYLPWHIFTWTMVSNGMEGPISWGLISSTSQGFLRILPNLMGWPLLIVSIMGAVAALRRREDVFASAHLATVLLVVAFHCISPNGAEARRVLMAVPSMLYLSAYGMMRLPLPRLAAGQKAVAYAVLAVVSCASVFQIVAKSTVGYRDAAGWLHSRTAKGQAVFLASLIDGEGMLVSEFARKESRPEVYVLRASKILADSDWMGKDYRLTLTNPNAVRSALDSVPVRYLVVDRFPGVPSLGHYEMINRLLKEQSDKWIVRRRVPARLPKNGEPGEIVVYERVSSEPSKVGALQINMRRMLGRPIER